MPAPGATPTEIGQDLLQEALHYLEADPMIGVGAVGLGAMVVGGRMGGRLGARKLAHRQAAQDGYALPMFIREERNVDRLEKVGQTLSISRTGSILALGATRSGKTETGKHIVAQMQASDDEPMVVYDHKTDYQEFFDEIGRDYIKLSSRGSTHTWNIFQEIKNEDDAREVARSIFAEVESASGSSGAFFGPAARQVFTIVLRYLKKQAKGTGDSPTNGSLIGFFQSHDATEAYERLSSVEEFSGIASHLDPEAEKKQGGIWSNLQLAMEDYFTGDFARGLGDGEDGEDEQDDADADEAPDEGEDTEPAGTEQTDEQHEQDRANNAEDEAESTDQADDQEEDDAENDQEDDEEQPQYADGFSIREYMKNPNGKALILDRPPREGDTTAPMFRLLIDLAAREALADEDRGAYLILDEIAKVPAINRLDALVNVGAGLNTQVFATLQSVAQLRDSYGEEGASSILAGFRTTALLRSDDPKSVEFVRSKIGQERQEFTAHVEKANLHKGRKKTMHREMEEKEKHVFAESDINSWDPGQGVLVRPQSWAFGRIKLYNS